MNISIKYSLLFDDPDELDLHMSLSFLYNIHVCPFVFKNILSPF